MKPTPTGAAHTKRWNDMKILKLTIASICLIFIGYILGTMIQPQFVGFVKPDIHFQEAVNTPNPDGNGVPRISIDKINLVQDRIDEEELEWTHAIPSGGNIQIITYGFQPWSRKRVEEKTRISADILREFENKNNSNQELERTVKTPVE